MMMKEAEWVSVKDRLPTKDGFYRIKGIVGSATVGPFEREKAMFKSINGGRFCVGDWHTVTHWMETE